MFKRFDTPREFKICMYCPNGNEFISFEKVESDFDLAVTIESIFDTEYNNVYEIQFVEDTTHEMKKWLLVKNGVTIGYMEEI
jgi:hypothetical protein